MLLFRCRLFDIGDNLVGTVDSGSKSSESCLPFGRGLATSFGTGILIELGFVSGSSGETGSLNDACGLLCFEGYCDRLGGCCNVPHSLLSKE